LIVLLTIGLRFTGLTFDSLWLDEAYQTVVESYGNELPALTDARGETFLFNPGKPASIANVLSNFRKVDPLCPPLFAVTMNRWLTAFGGSDFSLRALAAAISAASVLVIYWLGSVLIGRNVAIMACLIQAISPFDIAYAQEARMYSLVVLTAALSCGAFILLLSRRQRLSTLFFALIYIVSTWALINTHYTGLFIWAFELAAGLCLALFRRDWLLLSWLLIANLLIAALCSPWYSMFQQAASIRTASFYVAREATWWWPLWGVAVRLPLNWVFFLAGKRVMTFAGPIYFFALAILALGFQDIFKCAWEWLKTNCSLLARAGKTSPVGVDARADELNYVSLLLAGWCIVPALGVWLVDVIESHRLIEITRYLVGTAPAVYLVAGIGARRALRWGKLGYCLIGLYAAFAFANNAYAHVVHQREDWRKAAYLVGQVCSRDEVLLVSQYYDIVCLDRYLSRPLRQIGISPAMGSEKIDHLVNDEIRPRPDSFWILTAQEGDRAFAMIPQNFKVTTQFDLGHALHLRRYVRSR
jgi:hypothetical protein